MQALSTVSWDFIQGWYCPKEVWRSPIKRIRGESLKESAPTTCDINLNSFQHDISLNQAYKRLHCVSWCCLGWTRVIVQPDRSAKKKKTGAGWSFHCSINGKGPLSKFPAKKITQGEVERKLTQSRFSKHIIRERAQCGHIFLVKKNISVKLLPQTQSINSFKIL